MNIFRGILNILISYIIFKPFSFYRMLVPPMFIKARLITTFHAEHFIALMRISAAV